MANMTAWLTYVLGAVASFLGSEPIIYLFGLIILCFVVKVLRTLLTV